jgi:hypothetical protein
MPANRRRPGQPRLPLRIPAVTERVDTPGDPEVGEAQNLSPSGVALRLETTLAPGAAVRVTLRLSRRPPLTLAGTVLWVRPHPDLPGWALGIRFDAELPGELVAEIGDEEHPPWVVSPG